MNHKKPTGRSVYKIGIPISLSELLATSIPQLWNTPKE